MVFERLLHFVCVCVCVCGGGGGGEGGSLPCLGIGVPLGGLKP